MKIFETTNYCGMIRTSFYGVISETKSTAQLVELQREYVGTTDKFGWYHVKAGNKRVYDAKPFRATKRDGVLRCKLHGCMCTLKEWDGKAVENH